MATMTDVKESLTDRKIKLLQSYSCKDLFADWESYEDQIATWVQERVGVDDEYRAAQAQLEEAETLAALNVEGKNETERKARKVEYLRTDANYQAALSLVQELRSKIETLDAQIDLTKRRAKRVEAKIRYYSVVIGALSE